MEETRPILYGVADYAEIRRANAWFVDRTARWTSSPTAASVCWTKRFKPGSTMSKMMTHSKKAKRISFPNGNGEITLVQCGCRQVCKLLLSKDLMT